MGYYSDYAKEATNKYIKNKQKRIFVNYKKDYFEEYIQPAIKKSGKPTATFIKEAVQEKIAREHLLDDIEIES